MPSTELPRREFIAACGAFAAGLLAREKTVTAADTVKPALSRPAELPRPLVRFGVLSDVHYADKDAKEWGFPAGFMNFRDSLDKLRACVDKMNRRKPDFIIELGDFKDFSGPKTLAYLDDCEKVFRGFNGGRYHVLGNHDMDRITKEEFLAHVENTGFPKALPHYSFNRNTVKFIVLDACYNDRMQSYGPGVKGKGSYIPPEELAWLRAELQTDAAHAVVFCHQRFDPGAFHGINNAAEIRQVLEDSGKVRAVFTGHEHFGGEYFLNGIQYHSIRGMTLYPATRCNHFCEAAIYPDGRTTITVYARGVNSRNPE